MYPPSDFDGRKNCTKNRAPLGLIGLRPALDSGSWLKLQWEQPWPGVVGAEASGVVEARLAVVVGEAAALRVPSRPRRWTWSPDARHRKCTASASRDETCSRQGRAASGWHGCGLGAGWAGCVIQRQRAAAARRPLHHGGLRCTARHCAGRPHWEVIKAKSMAVTARGGDGRRRRRQRQRHRKSLPPKLATIAEPPISILLVVQQLRARARSNRHPMGHGPCHGRDGGDGG